MEIGNFLLDASGDAMGVGSYQPTATPWDEAGVFLCRPTPFLIPFKFDERDL
jgi:hypothetical protein